LQVGYDVAVEDVRQVSAAVAAAGNNGAISSMFYAEVRRLVLKPGAYLQSHVFAFTTCLHAITSL
jgi:hypothetical protein